MAAETATAGQMQSLTVEQVNQIALRADAYAARLTEKLGANPDSDRIAADIQSGTPEGSALIAAIEGLSREARYELIALVWCGQGEYSFVDARAYAQATSDKGTALYMAKKAPVLSGLLNKAMETFSGHRVGNG